MTFDLNSLTAGAQAAPEIPTIHTDFPEIIDNTAREQFFTCPRKFELSSVNHLQPARKSIHLHAGGAYAAGLEELRKAYYDRGESAEQAIEAAIVACIKFYGDYEPLEGELKTCERIVGALVSYTEQYPLDLDTLRPYRYASGKHAIEFTFAIPIAVLHPQTGNPILYAGRFDMLAERQGILFVEDDKTTSQLGPSWMNQWDLNSQFTGYVWAAKQYGMPVAGAIIRGQSILKHGTAHAQVVTYRPQWQLGRWYQQLVRDVTRAVEQWKRGHFDFALGSACTAYSGCEFKKLCTSEQPMLWLEGNYVQRHWNPTEKDPEAPINPANEVPHV